MQLYDENCDPVYLYEHSVCGYEGIEELYQFVSRRKLTDEELLGAYAEWRQVVGKPASSMPLPAYSDWLMQKYDLVEIEFESFAHKPRYSS